jgi:hypothetical protein
MGNERAGRLAIGVVLAMVLVGCGLMPQAAPSPTPTSTPSASPTPTPAVQRACTVVPQLAGGIEGHIAYVTSGSVPLVIYAVRVDGAPSYRVVHYVYDLATQLTTYTILGVEPGTYVVIATGAGERGQPIPGARLGSYAAADHTPAHVTVAAGATVRGIDVVDWPDQPKGFPALPTGGEPFAMGDHVAVCNPFAGEVNLRSAPGTSSTVLRTVANGSDLVVIDGPRVLAGYDWYAVQTDSAKGWLVGYALRR